MWNKIGISVGIMGVGMTMAVFALGELGVLSSNILITYYIVGILSIIAGGSIAINTLAQEFMEKGTRRLAYGILDTSQPLTSFGKILLLTLVLFLCLVTIVSGLQIPKNNLVVNVEAENVKKVDRINGYYRFSGYLPLHSLENIFLRRGMAAVNIQNLSLRGDQANIVVDKARTEVITGYTTRVDQFRIIDVVGDGCGAIKESESKVVVTTHPKEKGCDVHIFLEPNQKMYPNGLLSFEHSGFNITKTNSFGIGFDERFYSCQRSSCVQTRDGATIERTITKLRDSHKQGFSLKTGYSITRRDRSNFEAVSMFNSGSFPRIMFEIALIIILPVLLSLKNSLEQLSE